MGRILRLLSVMLGLIMLFSLVPACGDDDGGSATPEEACSHYCSCSFAAQIPNCQSTCITGINMASDSGACTKCTASSSCSQLENDSCATACQ
jgi:hypothetical protein